MSKRMPDPPSGVRVSTKRRAVQRWAFANLYRFGGPFYDTLTIALFGDAWQRWRRSVIPLIENGPVLDIGCGTGVLVSDLTAADFRAIGIDRERSMLGRARKRTGKTSRLVCADAGCLPFQSSTFSTVVATFPAQFILERPSLDEISRVLTPGGKFLVVLSGESSERSVWRAPIRMALRLFYGPPGAPGTPTDDVLAHPELPGTWRWIMLGLDRSLVWIATKPNGCRTTIP